MKILHVATMDNGGAAQGLLNLHYALLEQGVDSKILVAEKTTNIDTVFLMQPNYRLFKWSNNKVIRKVQKILRRRGKYKTVVEQWKDAIQKASLGHQTVCFTSPFSNYDITEHPLVKDADVVHLHWIGNFVDYQSFFSKIKKPIIWTLRDENPGLGGFHLESDKRDYNGFYGELEHAFLLTKRDALINFQNVTLVALSDAMESFCKKVDYLSNKRIVKIYNPIDGNAYCSIDSIAAKKALGIDDGVFTVSFVSTFLSNHSKGLSELLSAKRLVSKPVRLLCVGENDYFSYAEKDVICFGRVESAKLMSLIYSASDVFVNPTKQESFGKTTVEALLCGVPVISTAEGIAPEIINDSNGCIIDNTCPHTIAHAIAIVNEREYDHSFIRENVKSMFDPRIIAFEYIKLYEDSIKGFV